jgi:hypothetical protein
VRQVGYLQGPRLSLKKWREKKTGLDRVKSSSSPRGRIQRSDKPISIIVRGRLSQNYDVENLLLKATRVQYSTTYAASFFTVLGSDAFIAEINITVYDMKT